MSKYSLLLLFFVMGAYNLSAQVKIGYNPDTINQNAILELEDSARGLRIPRVQLVDVFIPNPLKEHVEGMIVYNTILNGSVNYGFYYNDGKRWVRVAESSASNTIEIKKEYHVATNGQSDFATPMPIQNKNSISFYRNGVMLDFDIKATNIITSEISCVQGDEIKIVQINKF